MDQIHTDKKRSGRPRNPEVDDKIIRAVMQILSKQGYEGLSIAHVSSVSGIARPTIKSRWKTREELCIMAIKHLLDSQQSVLKSENLSGQNIRALMISVLEDLIVALNSPQTMRILSSILATAHFSEPLGDLRQYILSRRGIILRKLLQAGIDNGEFAHNTDIEFALDALNGPILYRTLILGMPMNPKRAKTIVDMTLPY